MRFTGQVYRHPLEPNTELLEVTIGCSHNKCSFCTMYRKTPFSTSAFEHIEEDIKELASIKPYVDRLYLVNADPFVLSANKLIKIGHLINEYLPNVKTITGYASIKNIKSKTLEQLIEMRSLGFNQLHIGLETAYDPALTVMNKGFTNKDAYDQLDKLEKAGIQYDALLMLGVAGKHAGLKNIDATIQLLSKYKPYMISIMPTSVTPGSELEAICNNEQYIELTEREMLLEEIEFIKKVDVDDSCYFFGSHYFNLVTVSGYMKDKVDMIKHLEHQLNSLDASILDSTKPRGPI